MIFQFFHKLFRKFLDYPKYRGGVCILMFFGRLQLIQHSTGLSLGNLVDGLPCALHNTEALWWGQGVFRPAAIHALAKEEI